eukprot:NP_498233.1 Uncharacterized protein CELE_B0336.12 [Caenorhabditis elegans]
MKNRCNSRINKSLEVQYSLKADVFLYFIKRRVETRHLIFEAKIEKSGYYQKRSQNGANRNSKKNVKMLREKKEASSATISKIRSNMTASELQR